MKKTIVTLSIFVILALFCHAAYSAGNGDAAGNSEDALTNDDVLMLTDAGLPAEVIVAKIAASETDYGTWTRPRCS